jgi:SAM-dependent methyltransferase
MWDKHGKRQLDFLVSSGLEPHHTFLDVGCGPLRGGVHLVAYLHDGHYYGVDIDDAFLDAGRAELAAAGHGAKRVTLRQTDRFDVDFGGQTFDMAFAQSLFTHLPLNSIELCLKQVASVLAPGGSFFATFFRAPDGPEAFESMTWRSSGSGETRVTYPDRNPYHYRTVWFERMAADVGLGVRDLGDWGHPIGQEMLEFTHAG